MAEDDTGFELGDYLVSQATNNFWSNHRLHKACEALPTAEYFASRPSFFGSIHAHLDHIVFVDRLYLERLTGQRSRLSTVDDLLHTDLAAPMRDQVDTDRVLIDFCRSMDSGKLKSIVTFELMNGSRYTEAVVNVLAHLFTHQIHHRGQVHDMLCATSIAPPQLDEFFLRSDLPYRRVELQTLGLAAD